MSKLYFTVNYYFKSDGWTDELKDKAEDCYMKIRHEWVNMTNPYIKSCNESWDSANPELKHIKLEGENLDRYDRFMSEELNACLLMEYGKFPGDDLFYGRCNPDYPDFRLVYRQDENMFVDYDMTPV